MHRTGDHRMKSKLALLVGMFMVTAATFANAQTVEDSPFTEEQKLLMLSVAELHNKPETVRQIFEYCAKQVDTFALENGAVLTGWRTRNQPFLRLKAGLQEQVAVIAAEQEGMTPADLEHLLDTNAKDIASAFAERLEPESPAARAFACSVYAGKVRDGEFDVGYNKPNIRQALEGYRGAATSKGR